MKKLISVILVLSLCMGLCACAAKTPQCQHQFEGKLGGNSVTLSCKLCGISASADVEIPKEIVEKEVEVIKEVVKEVEKPVVKTVVKEVVKEVEKPVYLSEEDRMIVEKNKQLDYYITNYGKLDYLKNYICDNFYKDVDPQALLEAAYTGMVDSLGDPFSHYAPPEDAEEYENQLSKAYSGIGVVIIADENNNVFIDSTTRNSPAEEAGLLAGDMIVSANGESLLGQGIDKAAEKIRGEIGTKVKLVIERNGKRYDFEIERRQISQSTVSLSFFLSGDGYIELTGFNETTPYEMYMALVTLESYGIQRFILDVRNNGGGMVDAANYVADFLMNEGVMAYIQDRAGNKEYYRTYDGRTSMKYVVICNENSASATEMLLAGIKDNNEGKIVGTQTYGKGIVQVLSTLDDGSSLNLTQYQYFSPNGNAIHGIGITPDYVVEFTEDCFDEDGYLINDLQLQRAFELMYEEW